MGTQNTNFGMAPAVLVRAEYKNGYTIHHARKDYAVIEKGYKKGLAKLEDRNNIIVKLTMVPVTQALPKDPLTEGQRALIDKIKREL
jgi:hypothetical protein